MRRILLVDDHLAIQMGLRELLLTEFRDAQIGYANSEETALQNLQKDHWDLAIVDINLPGKGGLELIRLLKERRPLLKVLIYTMHGEQQFGVRAFRAGADGYVTKDSRPEVLFLAVRQLLAGRKYVSESLAERFASAVAQDFEDAKHEKLSDREHEVFQSLVRGHSLSEIAAQLDINIKTVSTYRARIFEKLDIKTHSDLIRYAIRQGLLDQ